MATGKSMTEAWAAASRASKLSGFKKYTVQPSGFWARVNGWFAIDPNRSTGVPLNPLFRNPPPGANDPLEYEDPVTVPAADIAGNPYWKRDNRRSYPKLSVVRQPDVVALLTVGSAAAPKEDVLQIGDAGTKQLVQVKEEGEKGLSAFFQKDASASKGVLDSDGLPPLPVSLHRTRKQYELNDRSRQTYGDKPDGVMYPCRTFV
ncbi:putative NADH-ubiquinone oxidoreductase 21 kDa subunit [Neohortaea acidophila]|uniref:Putative NADH-ubiquinone oxidoreductase 21 kDa subunit n=1 Tax=Neohortaea acidophila TaxID=245834 RepID=A0A6A6PIZ2_9PEZI|nr:putative NADH-ubiquinone oxidoreductase 21 kDa subunit [Neohortaea acidophila]KAF2479989.1 putative NADH-ubiquinone oxidoreductase 21 kDa subunit [Neohortaea acidophila]